MTIDQLKERLEEEAVRLQDAVQDGINGRVYGFEEGRDRGRLEGIMWIQDMMGWGPFERPTPPAFRFPE